MVNYRKEDIAMGNAFAYILAIVIFVVVLNFVFLLMRLRRDRYTKPGKALQEETRSVFRDNEIQRRLDREEQDAAQYVELRNKTLALYDEVRRRAAAAEREAARAADSNSESGLRNAELEGEKTASEEEQG